MVGSIGLYVFLFGFWDTFTHTFEWTETISPFLLFGRFEYMITITSRHRTRRILDEIKLVMIETWQILR